MLLLGLLLGLCTPAAGFCRLMTAIADHLPRGWRQPLRHVNSIFCAQDQPLSEDYLQGLEHPALLFRVNLTKQDLHEKVGFDAFRRSDYLEVDRVYDGPAARWNALKPLKALQRKDRIIEVNRVVGNATKMVEEFKRAVTLRLLVVRVSKQDRNDLEQMRAEKEVQQVLRAPAPKLLDPEPTSSKVVVLHAQNVEQFLALQPITVLMVYAHWCKHSQRLVSEFRRAAELLGTEHPSVKFAKFNHGDKANAATDLGSPDRLNISSYPALFLINGGQHELFSAQGAEEMVAFVSARVQGKDPEREMRRVLLKMRPMLYRDDTPPEEVLDLEPEGFDSTVLQEYPENNRVWIIEFYSDKCPFCRSLKPEFRRASRDAKSLAVRFGAVNARAFPGLAERFGVTSQPWIVAIYAGRRLEDLASLAGAESMVRFAREQHRKFWSSSPLWAKDLPKWPAEDLLSSPAEPAKQNGTWRDHLGRNTWFLLHTMAALYPEQASKADAAAWRGLLASLAQHYPCPICRKHLREKLMKLPVTLENRTQLTQWLCELHNLVNKDLHKAQYSCNAFELDLQYLKGCRECASQVREEEEDVWDYFQYSKAPALQTDASAT